MNVENLTPEQRLKWWKFYWRLLMFVSIVYLCGSLFWALRTMNPFWAAATAWWVFIIHIALSMKPPPNVR